MKRYTVQKSPRRTLFLQQQQQQLCAVTWQSGASGFRATQSNEPGGRIGERERGTQAAAGMLAAGFSEKLSGYPACLKDITFALPRQQIQDHCSRFRFGFSLGGSIPRPSTRRSPVPPRTRAIGAFPAWRAALRLSEEMNEPVLPRSWSAAALVST